MVDPGVRAGNNRRQGCGDNRRRNSDGRAATVSRAVHDEVRLTRTNDFPGPDHSDPPGVWRPFRRNVQRILAPVEHFLEIEAASGIVLMLAAIAALVWANSPWSETYDAFWHIPIGFSFGSVAFTRDLHFWINEGLMTIFFFVVGLEIRREMHRGDLSDLRRAALPLAAAAGGMLAPVIFYFCLNVGRTSASGWAVPMATDIAFAAGALALLGKRVPPALRILLLALAVIDDVGAIIVIALLYSTGLSAVGLGVMSIGIAAIFFMQALGVRRSFFYVVPALIIWAGAYRMGIHPTLAGVIVGLMTPVIAWYGTHDSLHKTEAQLHGILSNGIADERLLLPALDPLKLAAREAVSPVERLQYDLHRSVAFGIMPLFAFANAGVRIGEIRFDGDAKWIFLGVILGLTIGKPIGILCVSRIAVWTKFAALPIGVRWSQVSVVGMVSGIGFTMALFIAQLAFDPGPLLESAKLAILCGSAVAGILSLLVGYSILRVQIVPGAATTERQADSSREA